jgi:Peptidase M50B-like
MTASALAASLERIGQIQSHLSGPVSALMALIAIGATLVRWLWPVTQHVTTMAHEGAHATASSAIGRKVGGITFKADASGLTKFSGGGPLGTVTVWTMGYLGPSGFGLAAAGLIRAGYIVAVLWIGVLGLLAILALLRTSFGIVSVVLALVLLFGVAGFASIGVQVLVAYAVTWFLLMSGLKMVRIDGKGNADAKNLRKTTRIPHGFWWWLWQIGAGAALVFGATLLF